MTYEHDIYNCENAYYIDHGGPTGFTFIQADRLHDGLEMTYDVWKSRWEFHKQREWKW